MFGHRRGLLADRPAPIQVQPPVGVDERRGFPGLRDRRQGMRCPSISSRITRRKSFTCRIAVSSTIPRSRSPNTRSACGSWTSRKMPLCSARSATPIRSIVACSIFGCGCCKGLQAACCGCRGSIRRRPEICAARLRRGASIRHGWFSCVARAADGRPSGAPPAGDLFLDTLPYNAQTTTSDALWAGLPVLTAWGKTFAGRLAASQLQAIGLEEPRPRRWQITRRWRWNRR